MGLVLIEPPIYQPVTLLEAKAHLRVVDSDEDTLIAILVDAATHHIENFMGRSLAAQTWQLVLDAFPLDEIKIPKPPLIDVLSVKYDDTTGTEQTVDPLNYEVDTANEPGWVLPITGVGWPATIDAINAVRIQYRAGYITTDSPPEEDAAAIPSDIKAALFLTLGSLYEHREDVIVGTITAQLPWGAETILRKHRVLTWHGLNGTTGGNLE